MVRTKSAREGRLLHSLFLALPVTFFLFFLRVCSELFLYKIVPLKQILKRMIFRKQRSSHCPLMPPGTPTVLLEGAPSSVHASWALPCSHWPRECTLESSGKSFFSFNSGICGAFVHLAQHCSGPWVLYSKTKVPLLTELTFQEGKQTLNRPTSK